MRRTTFLRISALRWADILVSYSFVMQNYFTDVWNLSLTHAAAILSTWHGLYRILPVFFLFLADSFLGHYVLLLFTTISYSAGIVCVFMSLPPILAGSTHTCKAYEPRCIGRTQEGLLYAGLALIAVGVAGNLVSIKPFLEEQRDSTVDSRARDPYQVSALIVVGVVGVLGKTIPYIRPWTIRFGIPAVCTILTTLWFITGSLVYKREPPIFNRSPLSSLCRVLVAAALKNSQPYPDDSQVYNMVGESSFSSTRSLRPLHKAAIILPGEENGFSNRWMLCSVAEVEDAKIFIRMVPLWMTFVVCGIISATGDTYFVEQAGKLDRHIGKLKLPVEVLLLAKMSLNYLLNDRAARGFVERIAKGTPVGMGLVMFYSVMCCVSAAGMERMRLQVVRRQGLLDRAHEDVPMSIYWMIFQFVLLGGVDSMLPPSVESYCRDETPVFIQAYFRHLTRAMFGLGFMCSSLSVYVVGRISERGGRPNWFQETLNKSRLDRYYWVLAAWSSVNLVLFVVVVSLRRRRKPIEEEWPTDDYGEVENSRSSYFCL